MKERRDDKKKIRVLHLSITVLFFTNVVFAYLLAQNYWRGDLEAGTGKAIANNFSLLSQDIAKLDQEDFLESQKYYQASYFELKQRINNTFYPTNVSYGFYFEDLNSGAWIGINEKTGYKPASLMKVPVVVAVLRKVEKGELKLDDNITILEESLGYPRYGPLSERGYGYNMTVLDLINQSTYHSDNVAINTLKRTVKDDEVIEAIVNLGIPYGNLQQMVGDNPLVSTRDYSNIFRTLYYSGYLRRRYSQLLLTMLASTEFKNGLPAGVPQDIQVSHKVAFWNDTSQHRHDCGIVYEPHKPYIICVMTKGLSQQDSDRFVSQLSGMVYEYVSTKRQEGSSP